MKRPLVRALVVGLAQAAIVASLAAQAALDRGRLPRAWVRALPVAATPAVHGRYIRVHLAPIVDAGLAPRLDTMNGRTFVRRTPVVLEEREGKLLAHRAAVSRVHLSYPDGRKEGEPVLAFPIDYFVPAATANPKTLLGQGELWMEVSVPAQGSPRPLRVGAMRDGRIVPIG
jgi:hypothetical protein